MLITWIFIAVAGFGIATLRLATSPDLVWWMLRFPSQPGHSFFPLQPRRDLRC